jgi:uncharacterized protein (TIGR01244 family)
MTTKARKSLKAAALAPLAALALAAAPAAALAQAKPANPCAPAARPANPCAPASKAANPCAPAAAKTANPCAPAAKTANPCAPAAAPAAAPAQAAAPAAPPKGPYDTTSKAKQAPFGAQLPVNSVQNYSRPAPFIATAGLIDPVYMDVLAKLGFKTVVSLNTEKEGSVAEGPLVEKAGMKYVNIQVGTLAPTPEQQPEIAKALDDPANYPILLHCESANRVGAAWTLYRVGKGVAKETAIEEGRGVGMKPNREVDVRKQLGLPPL